MQKRIQLNVIGAFMRKKIDVAKLKTVEASISCTTCRVSRKPYGGNDSSNSRCVFVGASNVFVYRVRAVLTRQTDISSVRGLVVMDSYVNIANLYIPPNTDIDSGTITQIFSPKTIIVGDLNSKNTLWGSPLTDVRGDIIENIMNHKNFITLNNGQPTHTHHNGTRTHLDLSLVCNTLAAKSNWEVLNNTFGSDHAPTITHYNDVNLFEENNFSAKFKLSKADWAAFKNHVRNLNNDLTPNSSTVDELVNNVTNVIVKAAKLHRKQKVVNS